MPFKITSLNLAVWKSFHSLELRMADLKHQHTSEQMKKRGWSVQSFGHNTGISFDVSDWYLILEKNLW